MQRRRRYPSGYPSSSLVRFVVSQNRNPVHRPKTTATLLPSGTNGTMRPPTSAAAASPAALLLLLAVIRSASSFGHLGNTPSYSSIKFSCLKGTSSRRCSPSSSSLTMQFGKGGMGGGMNKMGGGGGMGSSSFGGGGGMGGVGMGGMKKGGVGGGMGMKKGGMGGGMGGATTGGFVSLSLL